MDPSTTATTATTAASTGGAEAAAAIATILENSPPCLTSCIGQATDAVSICTNFAQIGVCVNSQGTGCTAPADIARLQAIGPRISSFCSSGIAVAGPAGSAAPSAAAAVTATTAAARAIETSSQAAAAVSTAGAVESKITSASAAKTAATTKAASREKASGAVGSVVLGFLASFCAMLALL
ncbi:hypothetical protein BJ741DRAFT_629886 [Chytriomyces cf. hyalinus JEL632]|nr:hypothetical protein BJ741DRAFT_629886 [Chytriomyces cf. hyalinus JEL632]